MNRCLQPMAEYELNKFRKIKWKCSEVAMKGLLLTPVPCPSQEEAHSILTSPSNSHFTEIGVWLKQKKEEKNSCKVTYCIYQYMI